MNNEQNSQPAAMTDALEQAKQALEQISAIENKEFGGDWDEIEEARMIALAALSAIESRALSSAAPQEPVCRVTVHRGTTPDLDVVDIAMTGAQHDKLLSMDGSMLYAAPVAAQPQDEAPILTELADRFAAVPHEMWQAIEVANLIRDSIPAAHPVQAAQPPAAGQARELPSLPEPEHDYITRPGFTANQMQEYARAAIAAQAAPAVPDGCVIVPKEPTPEMLDNIAAFVDTPSETASIIYRAMIAAAPSAPAEQKGGAA